MRACAGPPKGDDRPQGRAVERTAGRLGGVDIAAPVGQRGTRAGAASTRWRSDRSAATGGRPCSSVVAAGDRSSAAHPRDGRSRCGPRLCPCCRRRPGTCCLAGVPLGRSVPTASGCASTAAYGLGRAGAVCPGSRWILSAALELHNHPTAPGFGTAALAVCLSTTADSATGCGASGPVSDSIACFVRS